MEQDTPYTPEIEMVDLADMTPYEFNPRDNEAAIESTANSIRTFRFLVPIILDADGVIVAGHTRHAAALRLGYTQAPTIRASHLTPEQIRQFRIIDNKVAELARWDFDLLAGEISALASTGLDFTEFGFGQEELDCLNDVVSDDCLAAGDLQDVDRNRRSERRAPSQTRLVLGEFTIFIPADVYRAWASDLRAECDFDEDEIRRRIKDLLHITQFEG